MRLNDTSEYSFLDMLTIVSLMLQIQNYQSDVRSASNDDLMSELQRQDRLYLERIIENQNLILTKLAKLVDRFYGAGNCPILILEVEYGL